MTGDSNMKTNDTPTPNPSDVILVEQMKVDAAIKRDGHFYAQYVGYNHTFEQMGHMCHYEYCIETQPLHPTADGNKSCPIFGHDCPGGVWQAFVCRMNDEQPRRHEYTPISG